VQKRKSRASAPSLNQLYAPAVMAGKVPAQHMQGQLRVAGVVFHQQNLHGIVHGSGSMVK
jgi:hypothetical protein